MRDIFLMQLKGRFGFAVFAPLNTILCNLLVKITGFSYLICAKCEPELVTTGTHALTYEFTLYKLLP